MQEESHFFNQTFYQEIKGKTLTKQNDSCSPWSEQVSNYLKQPIYKPRKNNSKYRYTSQLEDNPRQTQMRCKKQQKKPILLQKSVTICYEENNDHFKRGINVGCDNKILLPVLSPQSLKSTLRKFQSNQKEHNWDILAKNKRSSLKKYSFRETSQQNRPHFQIYKRSLIAAKKYVRDALINPQ